ncbi:pirin family protein [Nocardioides marmotae]|uniref:pirin family protein n=1 Tax=Nocardioides marmotae TaxID=2663857 RepID=UPI0012B5E886|nr:pirin family protein [Nocardioides marmotae]MBC9733038.1 pirin family protein [Nocardioides marmotae]MTB84152.1 pirin family protein [Nocardioides marmotae]
MTDLEVLTPRDVPLGGPRAMTVRRTLPQRHRSLVGAWCFLDHYGPDDVAETGGMVVAPHPHTGLQTVSWLFTGEIEHRDSAGNVAMVRPGELNLMTAGHGISHSEVSAPTTTVLHGAQLWVALPSSARDTGPGFVHHVPEPVRREGLEARVFLGSLLGVASPVPTHTPLLGAELLLDPGAVVTLDVDPAFEHAVLVDAGSVALEGGAVERDELGYLAPGPSGLELRAGQEPTRLLLLGGPPFGEQVVMWWNFLGSSHDEVVAAREAWQAQVVADEGAEDGPEDGPETHPDAAGGLPERPAASQRVVPAGTDVRPGRFGIVPGQPLPPIPAPPLPNARLRARG